MTGILAPIARRRRVAALLGKVLVGLAAFTSFGLLVLLLGVIVKEGSPALFGPDLPEWPAAILAGWLRVAGPGAMMVGIAAGIAAGLGWLAARALGNDRHGLPAGIVRAFGGIPAWMAGLAAAYALAYVTDPTRQLALLAGAAAAASCRVAARLLRAKPSTRTAGDAAAPVAPAARRLAELGRTVLPFALWGIGLFLLAHAANAVLNHAFLGGYPSRFADRAGIQAGIVGTMWVGAASMLVAIPVGVMAAIYLNEFARPGAVTSILRASISNLAGVPSIVFGILGLALFVRAMGLGQSIAAAGLTLGLLTMPIVIVVSEEALKSVPRAMREAAFGLGATRWQAVRHHVLPYALPGMLTSSILALSRTLGETAPLIIIGAALFIDFLPASPLDQFTALPMQTLSWADRPQAEFHALAWASVLVLITLVLAGNLAAILLRDRFQRKARW